MPTQLTLWFRWLILFKSVLSFWAKCRILYSVSFYASFWPAKLFDCSVSAVMKLSLRSSWETPWELNFCGCRCWDRCLCSLQHSLWVLLCWISPGTCQSTDVLAQPLVPVSGVRAVRCFHRPANLFWPKAGIPVFFPLLTELVTWLMLGLLLLVCKEGCRWSYSQKALEGEAPASSPRSLGMMAEVSSTCLVRAVHWPVCCHSPQTFVATWSYVSKPFQPRSFISVGSCWQ